MFTVNRLCNKGLAVLNFYEKAEVTISLVIFMLVVNIFWLDGKFPVFVNLEMFEGN